MVKKTIEYVKDTEEVVPLELQLDFPFTDDALLAKVEAAIKAHPGKIRLAVFSHIVSVPGVILPIEKLVKLCRSHQVLCMIDGAHAFGQLKLNLKEIGDIPLVSLFPSDADFYTSNGHKWGFTPRSAAFLYVRPGLTVHPHIISFGYKMGMQNEFGYLGTADYT